MFTMFIPYVLLGVATVVAIGLVFDHRCDLMECDEDEAQAAAEI